MQLIPEIGKLYQFKESNREHVMAKYRYYFTGLLLCTQIDVVQDLSEDHIPVPIKEYIIKNPIYGFEAYECRQHFQDTVMPVEGIRITDFLYLTFSEVNDMLEEARAE